MENKRNIVLDTSTLISAFLFKKSPPYKALKKAEKEYTIVQSVYSSAELLEVIYREKFDKYLTDKERSIYLSEFLSLSKKINPVYPVENTCRDLKDIPFLELATTANAVFIISSDKDLLELNPFNNIKILKPSEFINT
jgi:putative PIN family toxin of toxin-antitoxin system